MATCVGGDAPRTLRPSDLIGLGAAQAQPPEEQPEEPPAQSPAVPWGRPGAGWLTFTAGAAYDFDDGVDAALSLAYSEFIVEGVEVGVEAALWGFDQQRDDTVGGSLSLIFKHHVLRRDSYSVFIEAGIGVLISADDVPDAGTSFNFLPRVGVGATWRLSEDWRAVGAVRWHHISNARIEGDSSNPARDGLMLVLGLQTRF